MATVHLCDICKKMSSSDGKETPEFSVSVCSNRNMARSTPDTTYDEVCTSCSGEVRQFLRELVAGKGTQLKDDRKWND